MKGHRTSRFSLLLVLFALLAALLALPWGPRASAADPALSPPLADEPQIIATTFYTTFLPISTREYLPNLLYSESFSDPNSGWLSHSTNDAQWRYQLGSYDILVQQPYSWGGVRAPFTPPAGYAVKADMWRLDNLSSIYGLVFNQSDWKHYDVFAVNPGTQSYALWRVNDNNRIYLVGWTPSAAIAPASASNTLMAAWDGQQLTLHVNQTLLQTLPGVVAPGAGRRAGLYAESSDSATAIRFDNFQVASKGSAAQAEVLPSAATATCDGGEGVYLYEHVNYQGTCEKLTDDAPALISTLLGENIASSIRFVGIWRATLYDLSNYQGDSTSFTQDDPDLGNDLIYHDRASSLRVQSGGSGSACSPVGQFCASYYSNRTLSGQPTLTRTESSIDYNWGDSGPGHGIPVDGFSARWVGRFTFTAGVYTFIARADDGVRVWIDGTLILDEWRDQTVSEYRVSRTLAAGAHEIKVEYYEAVGGALAQFRWVTGCPVGEFLAEYYPNRTLSGTPLFSQNESCINHDWGTSGPGRGIPDDGFSVRWTGRFTFAVGSYTLIARTDDGMRVWLDGNLILDEWRDQSVQEYRIPVTLSAGEHQIKVEYYEAVGGAIAQLRWVLNCGSGQYSAEYYSNRDLAGVPTFLACESGLDHNWGTAAPGGGLPVNNFSARWTGRFTFTEGDYTFIARMDDGMRLWLDGTLILDEWRVQSAREYRVTRRLSTGEHEVKVEYFEAEGNALAQLTWERGRSNLALGKPAWATSTQGAGYTADKANDGDANTRWASTFSSTLPEQWWWSDLGSQSFAQVLITWDSAYAAEHCVAWSNDGVTFVGTWYAISQPGGYAYNIGPQSARYIGVFMHKRAPSMSSYAIREVEVYRDAAQGLNAATPQRVEQSIPCPGPLNTAP